MSRDNKVSKINFPIYFIGGVTNSHGTWPCSLWMTSTLVCESMQLIETVVSLVKRDKWQDVRMWANRKKGRRAGNGNVGKTHVSVHWQNEGSWPKGLNERRTGGRDHAASRNFDKVLRTRNLASGIWRRKRNSFYFVYDDKGRKNKRKLHKLP